MNNYMKTIISGLKQWVSSQKSDWNQNDSSAANFIKNRPFYSEEKEKVLFSGNVETVGDSGFYGTTLSYVPYEIGQEYKVIFAGTAYICKAFNNVNVWSGHAVLLGNLGMLNAATGLEAEDTGEPFFFMSPPEEMTNIYTQTAGAYDVSISGTVEEVHQIDKKFVPMPDLADVAHTGDYYDLQNTPYIPWDIVRYGTTQSLTEGNKKIARNNIGAAAAADVSSLNTTVSSLNTTVSGLNTTVSGLSTQIEDATDECITGLSVSGKVITYTKGDGSTGTITTQDTNTTYNIVNANSNGGLRGIYATAENSDYTLGSSSVAFGSGARASGSNASAFGFYTKAEGSYSHAEGDYATASGDRSHAEGFETIASGGCSHAEGCQTIASGGNSHAEGSGTVAASANQHVQGKLNIEDSASKYAHIVGNGLSISSRSNAHTLDWDGNAWFAGNIYVGGTGQNDATAVKVAIVPFPTAADEGKILRVVNGAPTWVTLSSVSNG